MKEIKIICDSEITIKNIKTGHIYKDEAEVQADLNAKPEDIKRDVKIIVPDIPLFSKT
jgi:2-phospho-L-lactate guanylyltransferase (CobY/MobA/RfbA family)